MLNRRFSCSLAFLALLPACLVESPPESVGEAEEAAVVCGGATIIDGIDVSSWQATVDWSSVAGAGHVYAIARISDGTYKDPNFATNWAGIRSAGLIRGAYQFFRPTVDVDTQADIVIAAVGKLGPGDLPIALDLENGTPAATQVQAWLDKVEAGTGKRPIIYTGAYFWNATLDSSAFSSYPLWHAQYTSAACPNIPNGWTSWAFWQYSSTGSVPGISGDVDMNRYNGTLADLEALAGVSAAPSACGALPCWGQRHRRAGADLDGDGRADACGRGASGLTCWLSSGQGFSTAVTGPGLSDQNGWDDVRYYSTIQYADVDGDGKSDFCGRAVAGFTCWLSTGSGFGAQVATDEMSDDKGWGDPRYYSTIQMADVNGDGRADVCGRAAAGFICMLSDGAGFPTKITTPFMSNAEGWGEPQYYATIQMADVNGDGKADVCGRAPSGFTCQLSKGDGFGDTVESGNMTDGGGWADPRYGSTIQMADVNGDGKADVCGRAAAGLRCWPSEGTKFGASFGTEEMSDDKGWGEPQYYSTLQMADVNGDGKADICGRAAAGYLCLLSDGAGFPTRITTAHMADDVGWGAAQHYTTIQLGDVDGDGKADVCARAAAGLICWVSDGTGFPESIVTDHMSNADGFDQVQYHGTLQIVGDRGHAPPPDPGTGGQGGSGGAGGGAGASSGQGGSGSGGSASGGGDPEQDSGCSIGEPSPARGTGAWLGAAAALLVAARRRRPRR